MQSEENNKQELFVRACALDRQMKCESESGEIQSEYAQGAEGRNVNSTNDEIRQKRLEPLLRQRRALTQSRKGNP